MLYSSQAAGKVNRRGLPFYGMNPSGDTPVTVAVPRDRKLPDSDHTSLAWGHEENGSIHEVSRRESNNGCELDVDGQSSIASEPLEGGTDFGDAGADDSHRGTEIPTLSDVVMTKASTLSDAGWKFRRPEGMVLGESPPQRQERFWNNVKPSGATSGGKIQAIEEEFSSISGITMATVRSAIKLKKKAAAIQTKSTRNKYVLDPRSTRRRLWKNWMFVNIMYTVLVVPWRISFHSRAGALGLVLNSVANVSFIVDTVLQFFTAVETDTGLMTNQREIVHRYLSSWFLIDAVSCIPFTTLLRDYVDPSVRGLTPIRGLRLLSLLKVAKVYALHYEVSPVAMSIGKTLVMVILAAHLLSCLWFWVSCYEALSLGEPKPWEQCGSPDSVASQYLSSFYFIIYTMMTVGYGDQHADPSSIKGLILSVIIQLTGATLFGFIIAATRRIVQFIAPIQRATAANIQNISGYALDRRLPPGVSSRMKRHFRYFYFKTSVFDERMVMGHVPWELCLEVVGKSHSVALTAAGLLQDHSYTFSPSILVRLARMMKPMELDTGEEPIRQGDLILEVYFVIMGRIEAYVHDTSELGVKLSSGIRQAAYVGVWGPGSLWGLNNVMQGGWSEATFVAASQSDLLWLDQADLIAAIEDHPEIRPCLETIAEKNKNTLAEAIGSETITKEGLRVKQISLTDFKASDLNHQLKHTGVHSLCSVASADKAVAAHGNRAATSGSMAGMVQEMAVYGGRGVRGGVKDMLAALKDAFGGTARGRTHMRLVRTWRAGNSGFAEVHDWRGRVVKGVMEMEETPEELSRRLMVLPDQPNKLRWDAGISMLCVLVAVLTPFRIAFAHETSEGWLAFDATVDLFFFFDILLRLRTAYVANAANNITVYITVPGMIAKNYLRGWMVFDVASTVPLYLFRLPDKIFRTLEVLKLLRIGRVATLSERLHRLSEQKAISSGGPRKRSWLRGIQVDVPRWCVDVSQILIVILYASHIFGCLWWVTSRYDDGQSSWWGQDGLDIDDTTSTYIASVYWAATTITTVGYGDVTPTNDLERVVACLTMVCGTTMFSYVIGSVSTLVMNPTEGNVRRNLELMNVENYLEEQQVGGHLGNSVRSHMMFTIQARSAWNEDHVLSRLSPKIRERVLEHIHRDAVECIPIFKSRPAGFVCAILRNLRLQQYSQGEIIYKSFQMSQGVYFVTKGIAEAFVKIGDRGGASSEGEKEEWVKGIAGAGKFFGYTRFLAAFLEDDLAVRASTLLQVYLLPNNSIRYMLQYNPFLAEELRIGLEQAVFDQASLEISCEKKRRARKEAQHGNRAISFDASQPTSVLTSYLRRQSPKHDSLATPASLVASKGLKNLRGDKGARHSIREGWQFLRDTATVPFSESPGSSSSEESLDSTPGLAGVIVSQLTRVSSGREHASEGEEGGAEKPAKDGSQHQIVAATAAAAAVATTETVERRGPDATLSETDGLRTRQLSLPQPRGNHEPKDGRASLYSELLHNTNRVAKG